MEQPSQLPGGRCPSWLHTRRMLDAFHREPATARVCLHRVVVDTADPPHDAGRLAAAAWGDEAWLTERRREMRAHPVRMTMDVPEGRRLGIPTVAEVTALVADAYGLAASELYRGGRGQHRVARDMAMHLLLRFSAVSRREIGAAFGLTHTSIPWSARRSDSPLAVQAGRFARELGLIREVSRYE